MAYTTEQKIKILEGARRLLGKDGQNWYQGSWFARRNGNLKVLNEDEADQANCWCLLGAMEESAFRLGYTKRRQRSERLGGYTSLKAWIKERYKREPRSFTDVIQFNDNPSTDWDDVKAALSGRLKQLRVQKKEEAEA